MTDEDLQKKYEAARTYNGIEKERMLRIAHLLGIDTAGLDGNKIHTDILNHIRELKRWNA